MLRRAFQIVKIRGTRNDPDPADLPTSLPLLMIDDLSREKIDRLGELGIDSAQILSQQNPFLLLPRLPYDLGLLVDWIAQAQLYVLAKDKGLKALRAIQVRHIFDLEIRLSDPACQAAICAAMGAAPSAATAIALELASDSAFLRLREVRDALRVSLQPARP